jgi:hypothetical protein
MKLCTTPSSSAASVAVWRQLFEAALLEGDPVALPRQLRDAKNAIMDRIEDSCGTASLSERRLLLAAMNTISELQRLAQIEDRPRPSAEQVSGQAA